jgi:Flp pilus assembly protein TadG
MAAMKMRLRSERGAELIEFAIAMPVLLLVLLGIFDFAMMFQRYEVVTNAAREGARMAVLNDPNYTNADIDARVRAYIVAATGYNPPAGTTINWTSPQTTLPSGNLMNLQRVQVVYPYQLQFVGGIWGFFGGSPNTTINLTAVSVMRDEGTGVVAGGS